MATINQSIDFDAASLIATEFEYQVEPAGMEYDESMFKVESSVENLKPPAPVVYDYGTRGSRQNPSAGWQFVKHGSRKEKRGE